MKRALLEFGVIAVIWLIFNLPFVSATQINIISGGQVVQQTEIDAGRIVDRDVSVLWDGPNARNARVKVAISSASLAKAIERVLIYKCKDLGPTECVQQVSPDTYMEFASIELPWDDISYKTGPQWSSAANLLILAKLKDGRIVWTGAWYRIERTSRTGFNVLNFDLNRVDVYAKSPELVGAIKFYIEANQLIPFTWVEKVVFYDANRLYSVGGDAMQMDGGVGLSAASVSGNEISTIAKEFHLIFANTSSGINNPITLNRNPEFTCGNGFCESDLGESPATCCLDCGCIGAQYCDAPQTGPAQCKDTPSQIQVSPPTTAVTQCAAPTVPLRVSIPNAPLSLQQTATGSLILGGIRRPITCSLSVAGSYNCDVGIEGFPKCGRDFYNTGPGELELTIIYMNGRNSISQTLNTSFNSIQIGYDCACPEGLYCDSVAKECKPKAAISLTITSFTSFYRYNPNIDNFLNITATVLNAPGRMTLESAVCSLGNITWDTGYMEGASQSLDCQPLDGGKYFCQMPFKIEPYNPNKMYIIRNNNLNFTITYLDGAQSITQELSARLPDVTIPAASCGNGYCDVATGESPATCCLDCPCTGQGQYCDPYSTEQCKALSDINISIVSVSPGFVLKRCGIDHNLNITIRVSGPSNHTVEEVIFAIAGAGMGWPVNCMPVTGQTDRCIVTIPAGQGCVEGMPGIKKFTGSSYYVLNPVSLEIKIGFPNGNSMLSKQFSVPIDPITIQATCLDEGCPEGQYCDWNPNDPMSTGECRDLSNMSLVIDSPTTTVRFDSCEITQDVNVRAHIANPPSEFQLNSYAFTINGSNAEFAGCELLDQIAGSVNCTIRLNTIPECSQGWTYTYKPNSMMIYLSYRDGNVVRIMNLSARLPDIVTHQSVRTISDIINDSIEQLQRELDKAMDIADKMEDLIDQCIKMMEAALWFSIIMTLSGLGIGGYAALKGNIKMAKFFVGTAAELGQLLMSMPGKYCEFMINIRMAELQIIQLHMARIQMDMCLAMHQHMMDTGMCKGNEQGCFEKMIICIRDGMSNMNTVFGNIQNLMGAAAKSGADLATTFGKFGTGMVNLFGNMTGGMGGMGVSMRILVRDWIHPQGVVVTPPYATCASVNFTGTCIYTQIRVEAIVPPEACANPVILHKDSDLSIISTSSTVDFSVPPLGSPGTEAGSIVTHSFAVGCLSSPGQGPQDAVKNLLTPWADIIIYYPENKDKSDKCNCTKQQYDEISQKNKETAEYAQVSCGVKPGDTATVINEDVELKKAPNVDFACKLKKGLQVNVTAMEKIEDKVWFKINSKEQGGILCKKDDETYTEGWIRELTITRKCNLDKNGGACINVCSQRSDGNTTAYCFKSGSLKNNLVRDENGDKGCKALFEATKHNYCYCGPADFKSGEDFYACRNEPGCIRCVFSAVTGKIKGWVEDIMAMGSPIPFVLDKYDPQTNCAVCYTDCNIQNNKVTCYKGTGTTGKLMYDFSNILLSDCIQKANQIEVQGDYVQCQVVLGSWDRYVLTVKKDAEPTTSLMGQIRYMEDDKLYLTPFPEDDRKSCENLPESTQVRVLIGPYFNVDKQENWWFVRQTECSRMGCCEGWTSEPLLIAQRPVLNSGLCYTICSQNRQVAYCAQDDDLKISGLTRNQDGDAGGCGLLVPFYYCYCGQQGIQIAQPHYVCTPECTLVG